MSNMKIPFDQLQVFHKDQYQQYVDQTLIVSTVVYQYLTSKQRTSNFILTKRQIYILKGSTPHLYHPTKTLLRIIRCQHHPQLVIQFADKQKSIRIATTTNERCELIVQGLSYVSNMFYQRPLLCFTLDVATLGEFVDEAIAGTFNKGNEETSVHKMLRECQNIEALYYDDVKKGGKDKKEEEQEGKESVLYISHGKCTIDVIQDKVPLKKIIFKEKLREMDGYSLFVCKIEQEIVICRVYEKNMCQLAQISKYNSENNCEILVLVVETEHKCFMFFQYITTINIITQRYLKDLVKFIINSNLEQYIIRKKNIILGVNDPKWKQSRYINKTIDIISQRDFSYIPPQCLFQKSIECFQQKIYSIGILLYHIIYKNPPFLADDFEISLHIKQIQSARFPKYLKFYVSGELKQFIERCTNPVILERFSNVDDMLKHNWFSDNSDTLQQQ